MHRLWVRAVPWGAACMALAAAWTPPAQAESEYARNHGPYVERAGIPDEPFGLRLRHVFNARLKGTEPGTDDEFNITMLDTSRLWSLPVTGDLAVLLGFDAGLRHYHGDGSLDDTVYNIGAALGISWFATANLEFRLVFLPAFTTDFKGDLDNDDVRYNGRALATYRATDRVFFKLGVEVGDTFPDLAAYPIAGITWVASPTVRVDVLLPRHARVTWHPENRNILTYAGLFLGGYSYNTHSGGESQELYVQDFTAEAGMQLFFTRNFAITLAGGGILAGKYRVGGDKASQEPAGYFNVGAGFTF